MIAKKMPLRSEDLVNQTALTLPEREMMDVFTFSQSTDVDQDADADADDGSNASAQNQLNVCWQLLVALVNYADYSEAEAEDAYQDCMNDDQESEQEIEKKEDRRGGGGSETPR